jgi:peptide/nickel transport system permease protein
MAAYLRARAGAALATLFGLSLLLFLLTRIVPGGPCAAYYEANFMPSARQHAVCASRFGLDQPLPLQYLATIGGYLRGDLGLTPERIPIWHEIIYRLPDTVTLLSSAVIIQVAAALLVGIWAARHAGSVFDRLALAVTDVVTSVPSFWLFIMLSFALVIFARVLPAGRENIQLPDFWSGAWFSALLRHPALILGDLLRHLILLLGVLSLWGTAIVARPIRQAMLHALRHNSLQTGRAVGLSSGRIVRHSLRAAFPDLLATLPLWLAGLLGIYATVDQASFGSGIGGMFIGNLSNYLWPPVVAVLLLGTLAALTLALVTDLLRVILDPRLRGRSVDPWSGGVTPFALLGYWLVSLRPAAAPDGGDHRHSSCLVALGTAILLGLSALAVFAPLIDPGDLIRFSTQFNVPPHFALPGSRDWNLLLGTDTSGNAVLTWVTYGSRIPLLVGSAGAVLAVVLGAILGLAATSSRLVERLVAWLVATLQTVPPLPLCLMLIAALAGGHWPLFIPLCAAVFWPASAAVVRERYGAVQHTVPILAARALGVAGLSLFTRHILPHLLVPLLRLLVLTMASIVLTEVVADSIGIGVQNPTFSWGFIFVSGFTFFAAHNWWWPLIVGLPIVLTLLGLQLIERGLAGWSSTPHRRSVVPGPFGRTRLLEPILAAAEEVGIRREEPTP